MDLNRIEKSVIDFENRLPQIVISFCREFQEEILAMNTDEQLFSKGINGTGAEIKPSYSPGTVQAKKRKGQPYNRVTLRDTGTFHDSFSIEYSADRFEVVATDEKGKYLVRRYGKDIFGLTEASLEELKKLILPLIRAELLKAIFV